MDGRTDWDIHGQTHGQIWGLRRGKTQQIGHTGTDPGQMWMDRWTDRETTKDLPPPLNPWVSIIRLTLGL